MKLRRVKIHNFRGIIEQEIILKDYTLLVGPNNCGKSTVIDAIRAFYEQDGFKFKADSDFPHGGALDQESWVELTFRLSDEEYESLADDYKLPSKELVLRKFFKTDTKTHDGKPTQGSIFGYKHDGLLSNEPFYGAKNVQTGKLGNVIYIPAISKVEEHTKLTGPSALRNLLSDIISDVIQSGKAYGDFSAAVEAFADAIRNEETTGGRSLSGFEDEFNDLLVQWEARFELEFTPPSAAEIIKSMLHWDLVDKVHGKAQSIDRYGSGFQRHFIYSLIQIHSRYVSKRPSKKTKDFTPSLNLILFEEPEAFLHPPQQEELARNLRALGQTQNWQVVCATHSPHFTSNNATDIPAIIRLRRLEGEVRAFQIKDSEWQSIVDANQAINQIAAKYPDMKRHLQDEDMRPEMEAVKYFLWLNPHRSSAFFANHVLLVEGATEVALINRLIDDGRVENPNSGLHVLDCLGKFNIHRFMNLFAHLGVPHSVIHDDDRNGKDYLKALNSLMRDSKDEHFTYVIKSIPGKLEEMLALPDEGSGHRKPQHALYMYETGQIDESKLSEFCRLVEECLPPQSVPKIVDSSVSE